MSDSIKDTWSVWWARVVFDDRDEKDKSRPVIVLNDQVIFCICIGVTSKEKSYRYGYKLKHWRDAGLDRESWVRFERLRLEPNDFVNEICMLHTDDIKGIQDWLTDLSHGHSKYRPD